MGLFDFFKRRKNSNVQTLAVEPAEHGGFNLKLADFETINHTSTVLGDVKIDREFAKELAHLFTGEPAKAGDVIVLKTLTVRVKLWGEFVEISFDPDKISKSAEGFVEEINGQLNWIKDNKILFDKTIVCDLLKVKNSRWLEENEPPVTEADITSSVWLISVNFLFDGSFELEYDAGNIFSGHTIIVNVSAQRVIEKAMIAG